MKKRNNKVIVLALAGVIFVSLLVVFILNYSKDDSSFSILEKKWINDNASSVIGLVFLCDCLHGGSPLLRPIGKNGKITVATIAEDAGLYVVVSFLCIVVEIGEPLLRHVVEGDVFFHCSTTFFQIVANVGGDGASYDIGYGGLDHVLASGEDINILVLDTEVYSNTGGQSSKSTPLGAIAQFAAQGKRIRKKDLGLMQTTYGYIYVAQVAMGADNAQTLKAIREAEAYPGPSLVIAYAPCINHGLKRKGGMGRSQNEEKLAVDCGYWHLWRYNPLLADEGKNPFTLDSKEPNWADFRDFLLGEVRYLSVQKAYPNEAEELFSQAERMAKLRYRSYVRKTQEDWSEII